MEDTSVTLEQLAELGIDGEILAAVKLFTYDKSVPYLDYVRKVKENPIAREVKLSVSFGTISTPVCAERVRMMRGMSWFYLPGVHRQEQGIGKCTQIMTKSKSPASSSGSRARRRPGT